MSFEDSLIDIYTNIFLPIVQKCNLLPLRVDSIEYLGKIDDLIINEIKRSRFLIADLTLHRQNVYYEIGFAHALNIPVIITCDKNDPNNIHFDIRQYNCIFWERNNLEKFKKMLHERIINIINK
jgi:nucleoside 2-deoxyribosyltransferase